MKTKSTQKTFALWAFHRTFRTLNRLVCLSGTLYHKIALALAFSPRSEALLIEARRLQRLTKAQLIIIHIGPRNTEEELRMDHLLRKLEINPADLHVVWEEGGDPAKKILQVCESEKVDLLVAGALKKENLFKYYLGSVARKILRKADCSVLVLTNPSKYPKSFRRMVIHSEDLQHDRGAIEKGIGLGRLDNTTQVHIMKDINLHGLSMQVAEHEDEFSENRKALVQEEVFAVERLLDTLYTGDLSLTIKVTAGKSGPEVTRYCERIDADLLVMQAPPSKLNFFNRIFANELEYIFSDLPTNLLIHHDRQEGN